MLRVEKAGYLAKDRNREILNEIMEKKAHYISWAKVGAYDCAYYDIEPTANTSKRRVYIFV